MTSSDARSHNGCWTCRVRRKKCDESSQPCTTCTGLHLMCHGYGPRPFWMDGGSQEKLKVMEFKAIVKRYSKQRRRAKESSIGKTTSINMTVVSLNSSPHLILTYYSVHMKPQNVITIDEWPCGMPKLTSPTKETAVGCSSPFPDLNHPTFPSNSCELSSSDFDFLGYSILDSVDNSSWESQVDENSTDLRYHPGVSLPTPLSPSLHMRKSASIGQNPFLPVINKLVI